MKKVHLLLALIASAFIHLAAQPNQVTLLQNGNMGLGISTPNAKLQFDNTTQNRKLVLYEVANNDHAFFGFGINVNGTFRYQVPIPVNDHVFYAGSSDTSSAELMRIKGNGYVGIGHNAPGALLDVARGQSGAGNAIFRGTSFETYFNYGTTENHYIRGGKNGAHILLNDLNNLGNIGIGTPSPVEKLHVAGNAYIRDSVGIGIIPNHALDIHVGAARTGSHPAGLPLYVTGNISDDTLGIEFRHSNGTQGIGFGYNTVYAAGSIASQALRLAAKGPAGTLLFNTNGIERARITADGKVGINMTVPSEQLHVFNADDPTILIQSNGIDELSGKISMRQSNFTGVDIFYDGVQTTDALVFETFSGGTSNGRKLTMDLAGNVGIGITENIAAGHILSVNGKIACTEVRVQPQNAWPDYVFGSNYNLMPLDDLQSAIEEKQHLPGIPSADEIHADGLQLGDMQTRMMEKIEELTLYILQLHEEIKLIKAQHQEQAEECQKFNSR